MKKQLIVTIIIMIMILPGCNYFSDDNNLQNAGMLFESEIAGNAWNEKGYEGLLAIEQEFNIDVFYKENTSKENDVLQAVDEFVQEGVNLIIGHGNSYGHHFVDLTKTYPEVQFIYMNGDLYNPKVTSLNFDSHAMGFFGGMVAGEMTETDEIGVIAVFSWQAELEGFYEGVKYQNPKAEVHIDFVNDWDDKEQAMIIYNEFVAAGTDVIVPVGNAYSKAVIEAAAKDDIYSIGYVADQHELAPEHVLTSMIQHVEAVYLNAAEDFNEEALMGGIRSYDFHDDYITLGMFNEKINSNFEKKITEAIEEYKKTNLLPIEN